MFLEFILENESREIHEHFREIQNGIASFLRRRASIFQHKCAAVRKELQKSGGL